MTYPDGQNFAFNYDDLDRPVYISGNSTELTSFGYDIFGRPESLDTAGGAHSEIAYYDVARVNRLSHLFGDDRYDMSIRFAHNPASQVIRRIWDNGHFHHHE